MFFVCLFVCLFVCFNQKAKQLITRVSRQDRFWLVNNLTVMTFPPLGSKGRIIPMKALTVVTVMIFLLVCSKGRIILMDILTAVTVMTFLSVRENWKIILMNTWPDEYSDSRDKHDSPTCKFKRQINPDESFYSWTVMIFIPWYSKDRIILKILILAWWNFDSHGSPTCVLNWQNDPDECVYWWMLSHSWQSRYS